MGILDEAIREHLELKRQHGAEESEVKGLESEAFGPADRPEATDASSGGAEAQTEVISPGSDVTVPAGEGDQLDKVIEGDRSDEEAPEEESSSREHPAPDQSAEQEQPEAEQEQSEPRSAEAREEAEAPAARSVDEPAAESAAVPPADHEEDADGGADAGDALEHERQALAGHPTEHYDVDAAIAEEQEIDLLSESSLSDELDRALEGPGGEAPSTETSPPQEFEPETASAPPPEAPPAPQTPAEDDAAEGDASDPEVPDEDPEPAADQTAGEEEPDSAEAGFFDQEDPLEGTPDFLEETPEHDRLWFEQKEPKDFDFGD